MKAGDRIRITHPATYCLTLASPLGTLLRRDAYLDYWIVRLDAPATYDGGSGAPAEELWEIVEDEDNMELAAPALEAQPQVAEAKP